MPSDFAAFFAWYLTALAAGLLALPLAFRLFRHLPERGYAFAKPLGVLLIGYAFWLLGSLGFLRNDVPGLLFAAALIGVLGALWLKRAGLLELRDWLSENRGLALAIDIVFLGAFALMAYIRAYNPEIEGTEKPMEFMFLNSVLRSPAFPPHDAWLSGHAISYYYFGYVLVAAFTRITATDSAVAFNLGLALLFALTAVGSLGVVLNLVALVLHGDLSFTPSPASATSGGGPGRGPVYHWRTLRTAFWPGLVGPLFVLVVGNFYGLAQMAYQNGLFAKTDIWAVRYYFGAEDPANEGDTGPDDPATPEIEQPPPEDLEPGVRAGWVNLWDWLDLKFTQEPPPQPPEWRWDTGGNWFFAARVVHDRDLVGRDAYLEAIDENPAFSFLLGDMHPHVLALPFVVLATGLALEWLLWGWTSGEWRRTNVRLLLSAVILGGLAFLNTWDFPIYLFLTIVALALGLGLRLGWRAAVGSAPRLVVLGAGLAVISVLLYLPFYFSFQSQASGILPTLILPTRFQQSVVFFGPVLAGAAVYTLWLAYRGRALLDRETALWAGLGIVGLLVAIAAALALGAALNPELGAFVDQAVAPLTRSQAVRLIGLRRLVDSWATLVPAALIGLAAGMAVGVLRRDRDVQPEPRSAPLIPTTVPRNRAWRRRSTLANVLASNPRESALVLCSPAALMALAMTLTGALLMLGPEYLYLRDNFGTRMNTLFKFYFQTWTLWALVSAFGLWHIAHAARAGIREIAVGVVVVAVVAGMIYPVTGVYSKTGGFAGPPTLDGMAYFANRYPDDWAAIQWLRQNVVGKSIIVEAVGGAYNVEEGRIAMVTGLPTVMGWTNHEGQWRGDYYAQVAGRPGDVGRLYQMRDWNDTQAILDKYGIEYVVIGDQERTKYNPVYMPKFDQHMDVVFQSGGTTIYRRKPVSAR